MIYYLSSFLIIPIIILFSIVTKGAILPSFNQHETWSIEYSTIVIGSLIGCYLAYKSYKTYKRKIPFVIALIFNTFFCIASLYTIISLWGDKY
jgi:uncharacterized membrane protein AbrB (regulator of aidB expression)